MSKKNKLQKFEENKTFDNLFQYAYERIMEEGFPLKGRWHEAFFHNDHPIVLELGCGKGEYTVGLARVHPEVNYIGVDIKGARMWRGLTQARRKGCSVLRSSWRLCRVCRGSMFRVLRKLHGGVASSTQNS